MKDIIFKEGEAKDILFVFSVESPDVLQTEGYIFKVENGYRVKLPTEKKIGSFGSLEDAKRFSINTLNKVNKMQFDAELVISEPPVVGQENSGFIFNDTSSHGNHPFRDGTSVMITAIQDIVESDGSTFITTRNTVYKLLK